MVKLALEENAIGVSPAAAAFNDFVAGVLGAKLRPLGNGPSTRIAGAEHRLGGYQLRGKAKPVRGCGSVVLHAPSGGCVPDGLHVRQAVTGNEGTLQRG